MSWIRAQSGAMTSMTCAGAGGISSISLRQLFCRATLLRLSIICFALCVLLLAFNVIDSELQVCTLYFNIMLSTADVLNSP